MVALVAAMVAPTTPTTPTTTHLISGRHDNATLAPLGGRPHEAQAGFHDEATTRPRRGLHFRACSHLGRRAILRAMRLVAFGAR